MLRFGVCVGGANANSDEAVSLLQLNAQALALPAGVEQDQTDTYWGCGRKGVSNEDGFGHSSLEMCAGVVRSDPECITGQFDYNRKYKGQCKCVIKSTTPLSQCAPICPRDNDSQGANVYMAHCHNPSRTSTQGHGSRCGVSDVGSGHTFEQTDVEAMKT